MYTPPQQSPISLVCVLSRQRPSQVRCLFLSVFLLLLVCAVACGRPLPYCGWYFCSCSFSSASLFLAGVADRQMIYAIALLVKKGLASGLKNTKETFFQMLVSFLEELYSLAFSIAVRSLLLLSAFLCFFLLFFPWLLYPLPSFSFV